MKIQRGIVEYKGRNDIECLYAVTDDKKIYYFLDAKDDNKYSNGARLASTVLLEVVDLDAPKSHIGVLGDNGDEIIPFIHREIVPINEENPEVLLAKLADPTAPCVVEANKAKNDPTLATKLVSNQALIKDKMKSKMGSDGVFLFHNQFLEATVYDVNGRNLAGDGYYSFIGFSKGKLFFSLNTPESEIVETSLFPIDENDNDSSINVEEAVLSQDVVENAMTANEDLQPPVVDEVSYLGDDSVLVNEESVTEEKNSDDEVETNNIDLEKEENLDSDLVDSDDKNEQKKDLDIVSEDIDVTDKENDDYTNELATELFDSKDEKVDDISEDENNSYDSNYYDSIESFQDVSYDSSLNNNIGDIASFISRLMEKYKDVLLSNKNLIQSNQTLKNNLKKVTDSKNEVLRRNGMMEQKVEMQEQRIKKQDQKITSLMDRLQELEGKNQEMVSRISNYQKELNSYNTQKAELDKVLKDAKELLKDDSYDFSDEDYNFAA